MHGRGALLLHPTHLACVRALKVVHLDGQVVTQRLSETHGCIFAPISARRNVLACGLTANHLPSSATVLRVHM